MGSMSFKKRLLGLNSIRPYLMRFCTLVGKQCFSALVMATYNLFFVDDGNSGVSVTTTSTTSGTGKEALKGENIDDIKAKKEELTQKFYEISEKLYQAAGAAQGDPNAQGPAGDPGANYTDFTEADNQ